MPGTTLKGLQLSQAVIPVLKFADNLEVTGSPKTVTDGLGNDTGLSLSSAGIGANEFKFPATQVPSADANTLDDYEEGTWTPAVGGTATYAAQSGTYTKIGRTVHFTLALTITLIGTGSTSDISGLPFTCSALNYAAPVLYWATLALTPVYMAGIVLGASTTVRLVGAGAAAATLTYPYAALGNGAQVQISGTYFV